MKKSVEIWKPVKGFEGIYEISNFGRLKSFKTDKNGFILQQTNKKNGYFSVVLKSRFLTKHTRIHRLVAEAFIDNPENKKEVNHIDLNKQNNHFKNLEWVTPKENIKHAMENGVNFCAKMIESNIAKSKRILQKSLDGVEIAVYKNSKIASEQTGVCRRNILQVAGKSEYKKGMVRSQAGGFKWEFL